MSGYGAAFIIAIISISLIPITYYVWYNSQLEISKLGYKYLQKYDMFSNRERYRIFILDDSITWVENNKLTFWIKNIGSRSIKITDFKYIDLIITYTLLNNTNVTIWVPYNQNGTINLENFWKVEGVRVGNSSEEILNPIYPSPSSNTTVLYSGEWDPGESLLIAIYFKSGYEGNNTKPVAISFTLRNGIYDIYSG